MPELPDWSKLPQELNWLAEPAERYGHIQFEDPIYDYLRGIGAEERIVLKQLSDKYGKSCDSINAWLDVYPMTIHVEARLVYFTGVLLGTGSDAGLL